MSGVPAEPQHPEATPPGADLWIGGLIGARRFFCAALVMLPIVAFGGVLAAAIIGGTGGMAAHPVAGRVVGITIAACMVVTVVLALCGCVVLLRATGTGWVAAIACGLIAVPMLPLLLLRIPLLPLANQTDRAFKKVEAAFSAAGKRWMPAPLIGLPTARELRALEATPGRATQ